MRKILLVISILLLSYSCGPQTKETREATLPGKEKIRVTVSILPQQYFVRRIAGDKAVINVMIPPGHSPATYEPTPQQMKNLSSTKIYFRIGYIAFEQAWLGNITAANPDMSIIDTSQGVQLIADTLPHADEHQVKGYTPGKTGEHHDHTGVDPHIWLSPQAVRIQAKNILAALLEFDPQNLGFYENNYRAFNADINELNEELNSVFKGLQGRKILVFHPAWGYLVRDYNLKQIAIEAAGKDPNPGDLKRVIDTAKKEGIRVIFVQKQFSTHTAEAVAAEINGKVVIMDPLSPDWLANMKNIGKTLKESL